jgi:glycosyltransferase involved in cell wall biosynthesis
MIEGKKIIVVMPALNAARTLARTLAELPRGPIDEVVLVDDASTDDTVAVARALGLAVVERERRGGYGANQKTCYREALARGADVVVMLHPDYQYSPALVPDLAALVASGQCDIAMGSRVMGGGALAGGMPRYKYLANRLLTAVDNIAFGLALTEYHSGLRAFSREVLSALPLGENSDGFLFDNQILAQAAWFGYRVAEIPCPTRYFADSSTISPANAVRYGLGVVGTAISFVLARLGLARPAIFTRK